MAKKLQEVNNPAYVLPDPIKVEKLRTETGERMTSLTFPEPFKTPVSHSADKFFSDAREYPALLTNQAVWLVIKPWLKNEADVLARFWDKFNTSAAAQARFTAVNGIKFDNWKNERVLIQMAHTVRQMLSNSNSTSNLQLFSLEDMLMRRMGEWVMNAVASDKQAPNRLYKLLNDPSAAHDKSNRDLTARNIFEAFANHVATEEKLPTKKHVREAAFLGSSDNARTIASREFARLGLNGLPRG